MTTSFTYCIRDFKTYLDLNGIEYVKRKDGFPNMKYKNIQKMYELHKQLKSLSHNVSNNNNLSQRVENQYQDKKQNPKPESLCNICCDTMNSGVVHLHCGHDLCANCFALHMRQNNNCPYCRMEICSKPKKIIKMPDCMHERIIYLNIGRTFPQRDNMTINEYIDFRIKQSFELLDISCINHPDSERIMKCLRNHLIIEIKEIMKDVMHDTEQYYMSFM